MEILDTKTGVLARPSARIFPPLYDDQLAVHIGGDMGNYNLFTQLIKNEIDDPRSPRLTNQKN